MESDGGLGHIQDAKKLDAYTDFKVNLKGFPPQHKTTVAACVVSGVADLRVTWLRLRQDSAAVQGPGHVSNHLTPN